MVSTQKWNLRIKRDIDGTVIVSNAVGITAVEVMARKMEEESLPGRVLSIEKTKYVHGYHLTQEDAPGIFAMLRDSFTNELETKYP